MRTLHVILGPTASGKTAYSIEYAKLLGKAEIVNADSRQLYKYLDIGTAKITNEEMQGIPHHLLDVLDPKEEATAAWYQKEAERVIKEIHDRGNVPILVGGSMLYISAITDELQFPKDPRERKPLHVRKAMKPRGDFFITGISRPREELVKRINERTKELFEKGWVQEVQELMKRGYTKDDPGMKSHGYREIMEWLTLRHAQGDIDALCESISVKTRQYAKRQLTWWRNDPRIQWLTP